MGPVPWGWISVRAREAPLDGVRNRMPSEECKELAEPVRLRRAAAGRARAVRERSCNIMELPNDCVG